LTVISGIEFNQAEGFMDRTNSSGARANGHRIDSTERGTR
jgi:hypothetical protein